MRTILRLVFLVFLAFAINDTAGQTTSTALGDSILRAFQMKSVSQLDKLIPSFDQMASIAKAFGPGQDLTEKELQTFKEQYPKEITGFKEKCQAILNKGESLGIKWQHIKVQELKIISAPPGLLEEQKDSSIVLNGLSIRFSSNSRSYLLNIPVVVALNGKWYIGDNKVEFEELP